MTLNAQINHELTKFHGVTYDPAIDKKHFTEQLQRLADTLSSGEQYDSITLCRLSGVSFSALRNRISDLRVYHAFLIEANRTEDKGMWTYKFIRRLTKEEHEKYLAKLHKIRPIGNKELFNEMLRACYAYNAMPVAHNKHFMQESAKAWAEDFATNWIKK